MPTQFVTPVGRIVWGHPLKAQTKKDQKTKQPVLKDGQPVEQWVFGLAIPKAEFLAQVWPHMANEAGIIFPNGVPSNFSWKYKDGDGVDSAGKPYNTREGYAGCYVLTISTEAFAPQVFKHENGTYRQLSAEEIRTGDYVAVNLTLVANKPASVQHTPGLYVNPNGIVHVGYGQEIVSTGSNPDELFAGAQFALPAGASSAPVVSTAPMPTAMQVTHGGGTPAPALGAPQQYAAQPAGMPAPQQNAGQPAGMPAPQQNAGQPAGMPAPQQYAVPAHDFVQNAGQPAGMPGLPAGR